MMRLYDSLEMFDTGLSHVRKWMRCGQAIRQSTRLPLDTAYSLGDSLTFWAVPAGALADDRYVGHRRYHTVLSPIDEPLAVYVRAKTGSGVHVHPDWRPSVPHRPSRFRKIFFPAVSR